jgi:hypothetical protein
MIRTKDMQTLQQNNKVYYKYKKNQDINNILPYRPPRPVMGIALLYFYF